jgi:hypothetical protein
MMDLNFMYGGLTLIIYKDLLILEPCLNFACKHDSP